MSVTLTASEIATLVEELVETLDVELSGEDPEELEAAARTAVQYLIGASVIEYSE